MLGREEVGSIAVPVELAAAAELGEEFGSSLEGTDAVEAVVERVEMGGPVVGGPPAPEGAAGDGGEGCHGGGRVVGGGAEEGVAEV